MLHNINLGRKSFLSLKLNSSKKSLRLLSCKTLVTMTPIMKHFTFLALILFYTQTCIAEEININIEFKNALLEHMPEIDRNNNKKISHREAESISEIRLTNVGLTKIEGLNSFPNLKRLILTRNEIESISIVGLSKLEDVYCLYNKLKSITLDSLPSLRELRISSNNLQQLDLSKVPTIEHLSCGYNNISELDISQLKNLKVLGIVQNKIEQIDISQNQKLETFQFQNNPMTEMDISQNLNLIFDSKFSWDQKIKLIATDGQMEAILKDADEEANYQGPPPAAVADSSNMPLILEVAKSCHYEMYYEHYKDSIIEYYANKNGWNSKKIKTIETKLAYKTPSESSYYNAYAFRSKVELEKIKAYNLSLNKKQLKNLKSFTNEVIIHNMINSLDWACKKYID